MGTEIDRLEVQVEAQASDANQQLDKLAGNLDTVSRKLSKLNIGNLVGMSNEMASLAASADKLRAIKLPDFSTFAKQLKELKEVGDIKIKIGINSGNQAEALKFAIDKALADVKIDNSKISDNLIKAFQLKGGTAKKLRQQMDDLATSLSEAFDGKQFHMSETIDKAMNEMVKSILKGGKIAKTDLSGSLTGLEDEAQEFYDYFKKNKIYVSDILKFDVGKSEYKELLQKNLGKITKDSSKGVKLNADWEELSERFPTYVPKDTVNAADQLLTILENIKKVSAEIKPVSIQELSGKDYQSVEGKVWQNVMESTSGISDKLKDNIRNALNSAAGKLNLNVQVNEEKIVSDIRSAINKASKLTYDPVKVDLNIDVSKIKNALTNKLKDIDTGNLSGVSQNIEKINNSFSALSRMDMRRSGVITTINALGRLGSVDFSSFDVGKLGEISNVISKFSDLPDISSSVNRLISSLQKIVSAGTNVGVAATQLPMLGAALEGVVNKLVRVGEVSDSINLFVQSLGRLASAGIKTTQTASGLDNLADAVVQFYEKLQQAPKVRSDIIEMTQALAQLASTGGRVGAATSNTSAAFDRLASSGKNTASIISLAIKRINSGIASIGNSSRYLDRTSLSFGNLIRSITPLLSVWQLFNWGKKAVEISSDLTEVQNVVDTIFGDMAYKVDDFTKNSIQQFGMSELAAKEYSSRFQAMGTAMGIGSASIKKANEFLSKQTDGYVEMSDSLSDVSLNLTKLTADMASFYNLDQKDVAKNLQSIYTGETEPLRKYGLDLTQATLKEWALKQGLDADISSMSQAEKTMLRYQYVMANTTAAQGDFARTSDTWANQVRILQQTFEQLGSIIGGTLINAFKPFVSTLNIVLQKVLTFAKTVSDALGAIFGWTIEVDAGGIADDIGTAADGMSDVADGANKANQNAAKLKNTLSELSFDELNKLSDPNSGGSGSSGNGNGTGSGTSGVGAASTKLVRRDSILEKYKSDIKTLEQLGSYIGDALKKALDSIEWNKVYKGAAGFGTGLANFLNGLISPELFSSVGRTISNSLNTVFYGLDAFGTTFHWNNFGISVAAGINRAMYSIDWSKIQKTTQTIAAGITESINSAMARTNWNRVGYTISQFFNTELLFLYTAINEFKWKEFGTSLGKLLNGAIESINSNMLANAMSKALNGISYTLIHFDETIKWGQLSDKLTVGINRFLQNTHWKELGQSLSNLTKHMLEEITKAITGTDWVEVGNDIGDFMVGIDWIGIMGRIADAIKEAAKAIPQIALGVIDAIGDGIKNMTVSDWMDAINSLFIVFQAGVAIKGLELGKDIVISMLGGKTAISKAGGEVGTTLGTAIAAKLKTTVGGVISSLGLSNLLIGAGGVAAAGTAVGALVYSASQEQNNDAIYNAYYDLQEVLGNVTQKGYLAEQTMYQLMASARDAALSTGKLNDMYDTLAKSLISAGVPASEIRAAFDKLGISYDSLGEATKALIQNADTAGISVSKLSYSADIAAPASEKLSDALHRIAYEGGYSYRTIEEINKRMDEIRQTGGDASEQMDDFTTYLEGLGLKSDEVTRLVALFGETLDKTGKSADTAVVDMEALRASISKLSESGDILPGQMDQIMEAIQRVSETSGTSDEKIDDLKTALEGMGISAEAQESILKNYSNYLDGMASSAGEVGKTVTETKTSMQYAAKEVETYSGTIEKAGKKSKDAGDKVGYLNNKIIAVPEHKTATITADTSNAVTNIAYVDEKVKNVAGEAGSMKASIDTSDATGKLDLFTTLKLLVMKALLGSMKLSVSTDDAKEALNNALSQVNALKISLSKAIPVKFSADLSAFRNIERTMAQIGIRAGRNIVAGIQSVRMPTSHIYISAWDWHNLGNGQNYPTPRYSVQWYKTGGVVGGEIWGMNENGNPEMVGKVGNKTAVANNAIIAEAIKGAVVDGMMEVMMATRTQSNSSENNPTFYVEVKTEDNEVLARAVSKGQKRLDRRLKP